MVTLSDGRFGQAGAKFDARGALVARQAAAGVLAQDGPGAVQDALRATAPHVLQDGLATLEAAGVEPEHLSIHAPDLDDVFFALTGEDANKTEENNA